MVKISLIMLTYNRKEYLSRSLSCCLYQDFDNYEIILINNASTDGSDDICSLYDQNYPKIKYFVNDTHNISSGRNLGITKAQGQYILFVDDDDYFSPDLLSFLYDLAEKYQADCAICGSHKEVNGLLEENSVGDALELYTGKEAVFDLLKREKFNAALPTKLIKRDLFQRLLLDENTKYDDISYTYKILADCQSVVYHPDAYYIFVRHDKNNSIFTTNDLLLTSEQLEIYFSSFRERTVYLSEKFPDMAHYYRYTEWSYLISMVNKIVSHDLVHCNKQLEFAKMVLGENLAEFSNSEYLLGFEKEYLERYF